MTTLEVFPGLQAFNYCSANLAARKSSTAARCGSAILVNFIPAPRLSAHATWPCATIGYLVPGRSNFTLPVHDIGRGFESLRAIPPALMFELTPRSSSPPLRAMLVGSDTGQRK